MHDEVKDIIQESIQEFHKLLESRKNNPEDNILDDMILWANANEKWYQFEFGSILRKKLAIREYDLVFERSYLDNARLKSDFCIEKGNENVFIELKCMDNWAIDKSRISGDYGKLQKSPSNCRKMLLVFSNYIELSEQFKQDNKNNYLVNKLTGVSKSICINKKEFTANRIMPEFIKKIDYAESINLGESKYFSKHVFYSHLVEVK